MGWRDDIPADPVKREEFFKYVDAWKTLHDISLGLKRVEDSDIKNLLYARSMLERLMKSIDTWLLKLEIDRGLHDEELDVPPHP